MERYLFAEWYTQDLFCVLFVSLSARRAMFSFRLSVVSLSLSDGREGKKILSSPVFSLIFSDGEFGWGGTSVK